MDTQDDTSHTSTRFHHRCYDVDAAHLRRIIATIKSRTQGGIDISIVLDGTESLSSSSLDGILQSSVLDAHEIGEIRLRATGIRSNGLSDFRIHYRKSEVLGAIRVSISGQTDAVVAAREDIERLLGPITRRYWPLSYRGNAIIFLMYLIISGIASMFAAAYSIVYTISGDFAKLHSNIIGALFVIYCILYFGSIWTVRNFLFPVMEFRVGKSGIIADRRDALRKYILVTVIGGIILSFIGRIIWERFLPSVIHQS